jgi:hypothetical protein
LLAALGAVFLFSLSSPAAYGQLPRTYVSRNGNDANPCTRNAPCRQIDRGIDAAQINGEVIVLNTGNFLPFTVKKAITVAAAANASPAVLAGPGAVAVTVAAGTGTTVVLRGLTLRGPFDGGFSEGISGGTAGSLHVEGCFISGFGIGIGYTSSGPLSVKDTSIKSCNSGVQTASTHALFENCRLESNGTGLLAGVGSRVTIRRSIATDNGQALTGGGSGTELNVDDCTVSNNDDGIRSDSEGTIVRVANTVVTGNNQGLRSSLGGALLSRSPATNTVEGNVINGAFTGTYAAK